LSQCIAKLAHCGNLNRALIQTQSVIGTTAPCARIAEIEFGKTAMQMRVAAAPIDALRAASGDAEIAFNRVCVTCIKRIGPGGW
jgi:hypothetical protein